MVRSLLLLALLPAGCAPLLTPTADASAFPAGAVRYDASCFSNANDEDQLAYGGGRPAMKSSPAGRAMPAPPPSVAPSPSYAPMAEEAEAGPPMRERRAEPSKRADASVGASLDDAFVAPPRDERPVQQASFDWGGSTWLSNDDSMSLASAQRLLWAMANGRSWTPAQVRPHELLNYFSFDTDAPKDGETFQVLASAEQHGDALSVAFAVQGATPPRQPLDLTLVVDRSGSMSAQGRMEYTKRGLRVMSEQLQRGDRVDVVMFDHRACTPLENFVVGRDDPKLLARVIDQMRPEGGTNVDLGLREGYRVATAKQDTHRRNRRVMAITDALMNTGDVNPDTVSEIGKRVDADGIRLTGVGVGWDFNDEVLNKLTEKGKGAYVFLGSEAVVDRVFGSGFDSLVQTVAHDVRFRLDLPKSLAMKRFYGEEASTVKEDVQPIHYFAGTSQLFLQDLAIADTGLARSEKVKLHVEWRDALTGEPATRVFQTTVGAMLDADPHNVRKARALMAWTDALATHAMGGDLCGASLATYGERSAAVGDDAEIAYVDSLMAARCGGWERPDPRPALAAVGLKVRVDSDIPIAEVVAACSDGSQSDAIGPSDSIARFQVAPGVCRLTLAGAVPMSAEVKVAETGADVRCLVRGGRLACS